MTIAIALVVYLVALFGTALFLQNLKTQPKLMAPAVRFPFLAGLLFAPVAVAIGGVWLYIGVALFGAMNTFYGVSLGREMNRYKVRRIRK